MLKSIRIDVSLVSIWTCFLLIQPGHARIRNFFESTNDDFVSSISNNGRQTNQIPGKLEPSWSCILLGEPGCRGTCTLTGALYGSEVNSECHKGIYCKCNEVFHFQQRDVPAQNFQNMPLNELWYYRFQQTPESKALLTQILNDAEMKDYLSNLLRDSHITGDDVKYLLEDEYPQIRPQLQKLVVNPHGLKSELGINGQLEYDNIGDYFGDLFERIKKKVLEKIESVKSRRRILELIRNIDNEEDLQYVLRQILLSGDDKLYNFVSSYLRRNGHPIEDESLYQPRRRFGRRRRGCRKRKRCGGGWGGGWGADNDSPPGGAWHGRPLKRKIVITHNDSTIKIDADEDEVIEIALINELKKAEEQAGAVAPGLQVTTKKQQQVIPPSNMKLNNLQTPISPLSQGNTNMQGMIPGQGNTFMSGMIPSQGNTYLQGGSIIPPQVPLMQDKIESYSMVPSEMNARPTMTAPMRGNNFGQESFGSQIPILPNLQESYSMTQPSITLTKPTNILQQESLAPIMTNMPQVPTIQQEIITPPQMRPLELPTPTASQYSSFITDNTPSISTATPILNQMEEIISPLPQMKPLQTLTLPSEYSVIQESMAPISVNTPMAPISTVYSKEDVSVSPPQMRPLPLSSSQNNFRIEETMAPITSNTVPLMHQIEELSQPPYMKPISTEVPFSTYNTLMQETLPSMTPDTISNTMNNIVTYEKLPPLMNQDTLRQNIDYYLPEMETSQYPSVKPILGEVESTLSNLPSTTTFYADQSSQLGPSISAPQTVYEYINSAQNVPSLNYEVENLTPSSMSSGYNMESITSKMPSLNDLENISVPSMSSFSYDSETPSNMANQLSGQFQNAMSNFPSSSLTSYINQIGLPQNGYSFQTSSLPSLSTSNMEWMSAPSSFSTMTSNLGSMIPQSNWLMGQTSNVTPQNDVSSTSLNSGLSWVQENVPTFKESIPSTQATSFIQEDTPRYIQQSVNSGNFDEELQANNIQTISDSGFSSSQNIENEIEEVADHLTTNSLQQGNNILQAEQNVESNVVSVQEGISQTIPDPGKRKKSLFYMVVDDAGNVVHSASVDHEVEVAKQAASQATSISPNVKNSVSQKAPMNEFIFKPVNYGWPYWG